MSYAKYRNRKTVVDNITFASKREADRYSELKFLAWSKKISFFSVQPKFPIEIKGVKVGEYRGDFAYQENGKWVCEDSKGFRTDLYKFKRKCFLAAYPEWEHRET